MIQKAWSEYYQTFNIKWTRGIPLSKYILKPHSLNDEANFYMVTGVYNRIPKLLYFGMVFQQDVKTRLCQKDHKGKWDNLKGKFKNHELCVSIGCIVKSSRSRKNDRMIKSIEKLLIFCNDNEHFVNSKSTSDILFPGQAEIINQGNYKPLHKNCLWGAFVK